jgi:hypothetical protein
MLAWAPRHQSKYMIMFATLGGGGPLSEEPGTLRLLQRASAGIDITHVLSNRDGGVLHAASARRTVRHPRVAPFLLPLPYLIRLLRPRPAPPLRLAVHPRGSALHHLIHLMPWRPPSAPRAATRCHVTRTICAHLIAPHASLPCRYIAGPLNVVRFGLLPSHGTERQTVPVPACQ